VASRSLASACHILRTLEEEAVGHNLLNRLEAYPTTTAAAVAFHSRRILEASGQQVGLAAILQQVSLAAIRATMEEQFEHSSRPAKSAVST